MRIACVQTDVVFSSPLTNAQRAVQQLENLKSQGANLVVFPEAYLTGYCVGSAADADQIAIEAIANKKSEITQMDASLELVYQASESLEIGCIVGFAGKDDLGLYNGVVLFEPQKPARRYIKTHLPYLGYDRFVRSGDELEPFDTQWGKIGILICFDQRPPEAARTLALKGADIIVLPTNWPVGAEVSATYMSIARAAENKVYLATCNRVGTENGTQFIGQSKIIDPRGQVLESANETEQVLIADLDFSLSRNKKIVNIPGEYEMEVFASRKPELYGVIADTFAS